jgi:uncharacterized protein (TIGR02001 family)
MNKSFALCAMLGILLAPCAWGQTSEPADTEPAEKEGGLSVEGALTIPTSYVFRGYVNQDNRFIVQPEVTVFYGLPFGDSILWPYIGAWGNLTDQPAPGDPEWMTEIDAYAGFEWEFGNGLTLEGIYTYYTSPADAFDDIHELGVILKHDSWLQPSAGIYYEICNKNGEENTYIELAVKPKWTTEQIKPLKLEFPITLGMTPDEYYTKSNGDGYCFGYLSGGITATWAFNDAWALEVGGDYIQMLADSTEEANDGDQYKLVGRIGVKFAY